MIKYFLIVLFCVLGTRSPLYAEEKVHNIVFIPKSSDQQFWKFVQNGANSAVSESGRVNLTWRGPSYNDNVQSQIDILKLYTRAEVDSIILAPTDRDRLEDPVKLATQLGIKVIVVDSGLQGDHHNGFVGTDNREAGKVSAREMVRLLHGQGNVAIVRIVKGSASTDERAEGFIEYVKTTSPDIKIIYDSWDGSSMGSLVSNTIKLLKSNLVIDGIFAVNETATEGVLRALRSTGRSKQIRFIGFDATDYLLDGVKTGELDGLLVQDPRKMGYQSVMMAIEAIGKAPASVKNVTTGVTLITPMNLQNPDIRKLLKP